MNAPLIYTFYKKVSRICLASAATMFAMSIANAETVNNDATHKGPPTITLRMFERLDSDQNKRLDWNEIHTTYAAQLERLNWTENSVLRNFDRNNNKALDFEEYSDFLTGIRDESLRQKDAATQATSTLIQPAASVASGNNTIRIAQNDPHYSTLKNQSETTTDQQSPEESQQPRRHDYTKDEDQDERIYRDMRSDGLSENEPYSKSEEPEKKSAQNPKMVVVDGRSLATDRVEGANVKNLSNKIIGTVDKVLTAKNGAVAGLIVDVGSTLGIGEKEVFVSISKVKLNGREIVWQTHMDNEALESLPTYDKELFSYVEK